jgi:hypothetical protein
MRRPTSALLRRVALLALLAACGSRTGLFVDEESGFPLADGGPDGPVGGDGGRDGEQVPPPIDARPPRDVDRSDCEEAGVTYIYVITAEYELYSFYPPDATFRFIGRIACPAAPSQTPFSMAVDRKGVAYVAFTDERIYRVSTLTAACIATNFAPRQSNFGVFGMGFATDDVGPTETLYVAGDERDDAARGLARVDTNSFVLTPVAEFFPSIERAELTGTGDGRLFAFYTKGDLSVPSFIGEVDPSTGFVIGEKRLDDVDQGLGWAFAFWGGAFYTFTAPGGTSRVTRYRLSDDSVSVVATLGKRIVGAGVSTCAPQQ